MQSFVLTDPGAVVRAFVLYCVIGAVLGAVLATAYWQWSRRPDMPQGFFRHPPSRGTALVIAGACLLGFIVIGVRAELLAFHRVDVGASEVTLHFALPERIATVKRSEIDRVAPGLGGEKGPTVRLVIYTTAGARHESTPTSRTGFDAARAALIGSSRAAQDQPPESSGKEAGR